MASRDWAELSPGMKGYYRDRGVSPATYNKWWRMPQTDRTDLTVQAKTSGYESGLQFLAVQSEVRKRGVSRKTLKVTTHANTAAELMITGAKGQQATDARKTVAKLFRFNEFDRVEWENFLSP